MLTSTGSPTLSAAALQGERFYALDAARAFALLIGIVFHGASSLVSFLPPMVWAVKDTQSSVPVDVFFYVAHVFRMQAFFMLSGFFAHMLYHRKGAKVFFIHRAKRIALPLILFWPFILVAIQLLWTWGYKQMGYLAMNPDTAQLGYWEIIEANFKTFIWMNNGFPLTHLWFLYMLLWFCAGVLLLRPVFVRWIDRQGKIRVVADRVIAFIMKRWWGSLLIGLCTVPAIWGMKNGFGVDTPDHGLLPQWPPFLVYGLYFTLGWLLHRQQTLLESFKKYWKVNACVSLFLIALLVSSFLSMVYQLQGQQNTPPQPVDPATMQLISMIYNSLYALASVTGVFAFVGLMMAFFSRPNGVVKYLSDASYWMYLIHLPVVVFFQVLVAPYEWHWLVKMSLILLPSLLVLLLSYHFMVRYTAVGMLLNGRRYARKKKPLLQTSAEIAR